MTKRRAILKFMDAGRTLSSKKWLRMILGLKLKQLRNAAGLSLKELSSNTGLSHSYLTEIEKGKKYPRAEKVGALAKELGVSLDYLLSSKTRNSIKPLANILKRDFFKKLPLEVFGMSEQDIYDLMNQSPEKFTSFIMTVVEIARTYDLSIEDFHKAALRSYQETNHNYFPHIEKAAVSARVKLQVKRIARMSSTDLKKTLISKYKYAIDEGKLASDPLTADIQSLASSKKKILMLNPSCSEQKLRFLIAKEIGKNFLRLTKESDETGFAKLMREFKADYFAYAFLVEEKEIAKKIKAFFSSPRFEQETFFEIADYFNVGPETLLHRISQIIPHAFNLQSVFLLRFSGKKEFDKNKFKAAKEMHLSELHTPHGLKATEHYCRRWITIWQMEQLLNSPKSEGKPALFQAQKSVMPEGKGEYLCLSLAKLKEPQNKETVSLTLGIKVDERSIKKIIFLQDPSIPVTRVGQTCERCPEQECQRRSAPPIIHQKEEREDRKRQAALSLLKTL